jgi:integrase
MSITRNSRYQEGSIDRVSRAKGPDAWVYRWREPGLSGRRVQKKRVIGTVDRYATPAAARRAVENLRIEINAERNRIGKVTVLEAWEHFQAHELRDPDVDRSPTTIELYLVNFRVHIVPRWGNLFLTDVKAVEVEKWLRSLTLAPSTKSKLRNHMSALYSHAIRHELYDKINPIKSVRQGSKRVKIPELLSLDEIRSILHGIASTPIRTAFLVAAVTALRRSEIRGLKWGDIDYERLWLNLARGKVRKHDTKMKTEASRRGIPIPQDLADALDAWRGESLYRSEDDWVFASPTTGGEQPIWLDMALKNHIRTAATAAGICKTIGWHTARRSLASLLAAKGESVKVVQELLRHAHSSTTIELYQQADVELKRAAQVHTNDLFLVQRSAS